MPVRMCVCMCVCARRCVLHSPVSRRGSFVAAFVRLHTISFIGGIAFAIAMHAVDDNRMKPKTNTHGSSHVRLVCVWVFRVSARNRLTHHILCDAFAIWFVLKRRRHQRADQMQVIRNHVQGTLHTKFLVNSGGNSTNYCVRYDDFDQAFYFVVLVLKSLKAFRLECSVGNRNRGSCSQRLNKSLRYFRNTQF